MPFQMYMTFPLQMNMRIFRKIIKYLWVHIGPLKLRLQKPYKVNTMIIYTTPDDESMASEVKQ